VTATPIPTKPSSRLMRAMRRWWIARRLRDTEDAITWVHRHLEDDQARLRLLNNHLAELRVQQALLED
jgi:hypothetical protein